MGIRRGGSVPSGCHTKIGSQSDGTGALVACRAGATRGSAAPARAPAPPGPARRVLGPPVPEGTGDHDRETAAQGPLAADRAGAAYGRNAAVAGLPVCGRSVPDATDLRAPTAGAPRHLAGPAGLS